SIVKDYSSSTSSTWIPKEAGEYRLAIHARRKGSTEVSHKVAFTYTVKSLLYGKTIMLDPGHGGRDPGAVNNYLGIKEKDYNNSLTTRIYNKLTSLGAKVIFTRNPYEDKFIDLHDRSEIVNRANPDLFLSIHHDSSTNRLASGMSVHYSTYRPLLEDTSGTYVQYGGKEYKFVREIREWWDPVRRTSDPGIVYLDRGVEKVVNIRDVMVYDNRSPSDVAIKSEVFAKYLYSSLSELSYNKNYSYIRDHNLHMTRRTNVPSALIEAGFISNNTEAIKVAKSSVQDQIAQKVTGAIKKFFITN
ncbi:N-acetylmuramoyl-L-alanine amidase, partial [Clostridium sp. D2Q-11]